MTLTDGSGSRRTMPPRATAGPPFAADQRARALPPPPLAPLPKSRRRPALLALAACLMAVGVLTGGVLVNGAGDRQSVLAVARAVAFGQVITADDLTRAEVSHDPAVATVPSSDLGQIVGRVAVTNLTPGSLLTRAAASDVAPPTQGQVLVAIAVPASRMPAGSLQPGDRVLVVNTPAAGADPPTLPPTTIAATVVRLGAPDINGLTVVDVTVATADGPALAARSATGRIALVLQPRGQ
jgi:hypothetical protein